MANEVIINVKAKDEASKTFKSVEGSTRKMGISAGVAAAAVGTVLVKAFKDSIAEAQEAVKAHNQTVAVLKSTHHAAGVTAKSVEDLATAISNKTGIDDEAIQSGENLLLTFTSIRNEAGKGNDVFNQATKTITDMSVALGQDMKSSAIQVGKALNDPIKGVTALQRVGVSFTESQKEQIKKLTQSGHKLEAQKIILKELRKEFGGSAEAAATWGDKLKVAVGNAEESFGKKLLPTVEKVSKRLVKYLNSDEAQQELDDLATGAANAADEIGVLFKVLGKVAKANKKLTEGKGGGLKEAGQEWAFWKAKALDALDAVIGAMAKLNPLMRKPAREVHAMRVKADEELNRLKAKFNDTATAINRKKVEAKIKADKRDLEAKVRDAKRRLQETNDKKTQAKIRAEISQLRAQVAAAKAALAGIHGKTVHIAVYKTETTRKTASGGNIGASWGGPTAAGGGSRGGRVLVGEQGPEVVDLPFGSHVNSNPDSRRMMSGGGGGGVTINVSAPNYVGAPADLLKALVDAKRRGQLDVILR